MDHDEKIRRWREFANGKGIPNAIARPITDRMISAVGIHVPPFIFWRFPAVVLVSGCQFGIFWGLFMYFTVWSDRSVISIAGASLAVAIPFGISAAAFQIWLKRKWQLPAWNAFSKDQNNTREL